MNELQCTITVSVLCGFFAGIVFYMIKDLIRQFKEINELNKQLKKYHNQWYFFNSLYQNICASLSIIIIRISYNEKIFHFLYLFENIFHRIKVNFNNRTFLKSEYNYLVGWSEMSEYRYLERKFIRTDILSEYINDSCSLQ